MWRCVDYLNSPMKIEELKRLVWFFPRVFMLFNLHVSIDLIAVP